MSDALLPDRLMNLGVDFWGSKVLMTAVDLGLFTEPATSPLGAEAPAVALEAAIL